ncbi:MAG: polyprenyl synthetase family protein, partial [bacterium]|nr:polyprenyl synthetase family protein [bacterium]
NSDIFIATDMLKKYQEFCHGGKKLRGALIQLGYELTDKNKKDILEASTSIEIIHSFLLMHDDIEDQDETRRGKPTIHKQYAKNHSAHYGLSMGINTGDLGHDLGMEVLLNSKLPSQNKINAAIYLTQLLQRVVYGQGLDVTYEQMENITEENVMQVHLHKTAIYTISGPLIIGAILGGFNKNSLEMINKFGEPVGIAFQLRDDELGLFSTEETLGKPIGSDIREGKNTLLRVKAMEFATKKDREFLNYAYGNPNISKKDVKMIQDITVNTGALDYSKKLSKSLVEQGKKIIPAITKNKDYQETLISMADFMISRNS